MNKKYCALLSVFLLVGCSEKNSQSTTSTSTPKEIVFEEYSFAQMDKNYEEAGVCPDKILSTYVPSYTNTTFTLNYHGMNRGRGENEVIIYNVGSQSNCNAWGYEVAVNKEGYVVEVKSLVTIPEDGFAISGHGTDNIDFITANFKVGQKVSYENGVITVIDNPYESRMFELNASTIAFQASYKEKFDRLENIDYSVKDDVDTLCNCSLKAQNALNTYHENKSTDALKAFMSYSSYFKKIAEDGTKKLFPSRTVEAHGVWHRPNERNVTAIRNFLNLMKKANMNIIYLETDDDSGLTYTDSKYPLSPVLKNKYEGYPDYLTAFIAEAHKMEIEVHAWDKVFYVLKEIYNDHPDWQMYYYNNGNYKKNMDSTGLSFFDPGIEGVKNYVVNKIDYILSKYDFDGYQFDYIRYPTGNADISTSSGYSQEAISNFGKTPSTSNYSEWSRFRMQQVTETVKRAVQLIRKKHKHIKTSIAVVSDSNAAKTNNLQDWRTWVDNDYIDIVDLMSYHYDASLVARDTIALKNISRNRTFNYTGISPTYSSLPDIENVNQIDATNLAGAHGTVIFAAHNIVNKPIIATLLSQASYRLPSVLPHRDLYKVLNASFSEILYKYDNIYIPNQAATFNQKEALKEEFITILKMSLNTIAEMQNIQAVLKNISLNDYGNQVVAQRIKDDFDYLDEIITIHIKQYGK